MAIITYPLDGIDYDAAAAETYFCTRSSGVYFQDDNFAASVTGNREITISPGLAWIRNDSFAGKSICSNTSVALNIEVADGILPRMDRIVLRFDKTKNATEFVVLKGEYSSAPVPPPITRDALVYDLGLYTVLVPAASVTIAESHVANTMSDRTVCGYMQDGVTAGGMVIDGAKEGALVVTDSQGNVVSSNRTVSSLGTGATYSLNGTVLTITTL